MIKIEQVRKGITARFRWAGYTSGYYCEPEEVKESPDGKVHLRVDEWDDEFRSETYSSVEEFLYRWGFLVSQEGMRLNELAASLEKETVMHRGELCMTW